MHVDVNQKNPTKWSSINMSQLTATQGATEKLVPVALSSSAVAAAILSTKFLSLQQIEDRIMNNNEYKAMTRNSFYASTSLIYIYIYIYLITSITL